MTYLAVNNLAIKDVAFSSFLHPKDMNLLLLKDLVANLLLPNKLAIKDRVVLS